MQYTAPYCLDCKHYTPYAGVGITCKAYPRGIPDKILQRKIEHKKPVPGQVGRYIFKKKEL